MRLESEVATVIDSDYAYIGTFLKFLDILADIMNRMFGNLIDNIGKLMNILPKEE